MDLETINNDMTDKEKEALVEYVKNGRPGLMKVSDTDVFNWFSLYMSGKTYVEIAEITNTKKNLVLYMSNKSGWYTKRMEHYQDLADNYIEKIRRTKLDSVNTINTSIAALGKYYGDKFNKFLSTNDKTIIEDMDTKMLAQYYKAIESLEKIIGNSSSAGEGSKNPMININLGAGITLEQKDGETLEINDENASRMLSALAKLENKK